MGQPNFFETDLKELDICFMYGTVKFFFLEIIWRMLYCWNIVRFLLEQFF